MHNWTFPRFFFPQERNVEDVKHYVGFLIGATGGRVIRTGVAPGFSVVGVTGWITSVIDASYATDVTFSLMKCKMYSALVSTLFPATLTNFRFFLVEDGLK